MISNRFKLVPYLFTGLFICAGILLATPPKASAITGSEFNPGRIIDDGLFYNNSTMDGAKIQQFLNPKVPVCDTSGSKTMHDSQYGDTVTRAVFGSRINTATGQPRGGNAPFTCLKDFRQDTSAKAAEPGLCGALGAGNKSAADIIYEVSTVCGINPQVMLVLLQKEQALITDDWPWAIQYRSATGYGCPDTAPCDSEYYGFFNQVYNAARQFKKYARDASLFRYKAGRDNYIQYHPNSGCGGTNVYIQNQATANLYNYTPYQPNAVALANLYGTGDGCSAYGNRNFWRMFNDWFGTTIGTNLVRSPTNPTYYLVTNDQKLAIPSGDILYAYGLERTELTIVSDGYLASIPDGGVLNTIFTIPGDPTVYLADGGKRHGIASGAYCTAWGLSCGNATVQKEIGPNVSNLMFEGGVLKNLMANQGSIFLMQSGKKLPFFSLKAMSDNGYGSGDVTPIANFTNAIRPHGNAIFENNSFVKFGSSNSIYGYTGNQFYTIPDLETYRNWSGGNIKTFIDTISTYNQTLPTPIGTMTSILTPGDGQSYLIDGGAKINLSAVAAQWTVTSQPSMASMLNALTQKANLSSGSLLRAPDGGIYKIASNAKLPIGSVDDLYGLGYTPANVTSLATNSLPGLTLGATQFKEARLVKKPSNNTIYATGPGITLYALTSLPQLGHFAFNTSSVPTINTQTISAYGSESALNYVVSTNSQYYVVSRGELFLMPSSLYTDYSAASLTKTTFSNGALGFLPSFKTLDHFVQYENGAIYYIEAGSKRPITSYDKFKQLGGTPFNTHVLPNDFLNLYPIGSVM